MGAKAAQLRALYGVLNLFACTVALAPCPSLSVSRFVSSSFSLYWFFSFPSIGTPWSAEMGTPARASSSQFVRRRCLGISASPRASSAVHHRRRASFYGRRITTTNPSTGMDPHQLHSSSI